MRVLHVTKWYPNKYDVQNGVFVHKHILCTTRFAEVKVLAWLPSQGASEIVESVENGLATTRHYFKPKTPIAKKRHAFREYIRSHCNSENLPQLIHIHIFSPDMLLVANWANKKKIPVVISEHWSGYVRGVFSSFPFWKKWAFKKLARVNAVLPVSEFLQKHMQQCGVEGRFLQVPNVVDEVAFTLPKQTDFTFVVVADLVDEIKNISGIIRAFATFALAKNNCQLHIIGGGPDEKQLAEQVAKSAVCNQIKMIGRLPNHAVLKHMQTCHVLINNSRFETFGVVVLEAHAAGIRVISTRCGGPEEWLETADIAISVNDENALVQAMHDAFAAKHREVNFTKWRNCLPSIVAKKLEKIYTAILAGE